MIPIYKAVIIDDENSSRRILEVYLRDLCPDFETEASFGSGKEALAWLEQNQADVVLTDVRMTEMSGIDVPDISGRKSGIVRL